MRAYLIRACVGGEQSQGGLSFACASRPVEWPGMHPIIPAHSAAMAEWDKKAKPKKSVMKVMMNVLLVISDLLSNRCDFLSVLFYTRSTTRTVN